MIATASAAATPAKADMITPSPPSGLSPNRPVPAPNALRKELTESPGSSAAWAAPVRIGEVIFIARGLLDGRFETRTIGIFDSWSPRLELWFKRLGWRFKRASATGFVRREAARYC